MLKAVLPRIEQRYALAGFIFGSFLPAICLVVQAFLWSGEQGGFTAFSLPAATALGLMPFFFSVGFFQIGRSRAQLLAELQNRRHTEERLSFEAYHDRLTGLSNRFSLERDIGGLAASGDAERGIALLLLDLDRFKFVNDSLGHDVGDQLLVAISNALREILSPCTRIYRLGGDEFVVMIAGHPSPGKMEDICRTVCRRFGEPFVLARHTVLSGCSIGITYMERADEGMSTLLKRADVALYEAKSAAGNTHCFYDSRLADETDRRTLIENDLARALANGEFFLEYQPIIGVDSRAVRSFEALVRWRHPEKGVIAPGDFIPIAEKTGFIMPLGDWVLETACREAAGWPAPTGVAVNVVGDQFKGRDFIDHIKRCLAMTGLAPGRLTIEVTESIFSVEESVVREALAELRAFGVRVALDDFGVGFASISNLRTFPLDQLKVDRSFAGAMLSSKRDADLVDIILKLGRTFQVDTTIEGIETESQLDFIRARGADEAQGFLISRPVPANGVLAFLAGPQAALSA
ncbi:EAL domain-containing protein [Rhizobium sp. TRM95111]|uniref:putative bifunctional diguanylate cyclase/phosphodiesterase n=1 Tax=Rhizobium alarense TaxID=2846851 RepID=UPI001F3D108D|nr:EAL domain-containing protein [Rhizobium alarense]MCF3639362.1 EAL domain-containing protein [Rhizobium alarense]